MVQEEIQLRKRTQTELRAHFEGRRGALVDVLRWTIDNLGEHERQVIEARLNSMIDATDLAASVAESDG